MELPHRCLCLYVCVCLLLCRGTQNTDHVHSVVARFLYFAFSLLSSPPPGSPSGPTHVATRVMPTPSCLPCCCSCCCSCHHTWCCCSASFNTNTTNTSGFADLLGTPAISMESLLSALVQGSSSPLLGLVHMLLLRQAQADMEISHASGCLQVGGCLFVYDCASRHNRAQAWPPCSFLLTGLFCKTTKCIDAAPAGCMYLCVTTGAPPHRQVSCDCC